jgi:hypothetical protein
LPYSPDEKKYKRATTRLLATSSFLVQAYNIFTEKSGGIGQFFFTNMMLVGTILCDYPNVIGSDCPLYVLYNTICVGAILRDCPSLSFQYDFR